MDPGLVGEGVGAHHGLVRLRPDARDAGQEIAGRTQLFGVDRRPVGGPQPRQHAEGHHDLFEGGVPRALTDAVQGTLHLPRTVLEGGE